MSKVNKTRLLCINLCLLFGTLCSALANAASQQQIQQLRTLSYSVIDNVLMFHNPNGNPYDPVNADAYKRDMQRLLQLTQQFNLPQVTLQAQQLDSALKDLRNLPQSASKTRATLPPYSLWLPQVVDQHHQLVTLLANLQTSQPGGEELQQKLHKLSWDLQRLSLSYQLSAFTPLVANVWMLDEQEVIALDASVRQRLAELPTKDSRVSEPLDKLAGRYHFVRRYLLSPAEGWAPSAVDRYLLGIAQDLDKAAQPLGG